MHGIIRRERSGEDFKLEEREGIELDGGGISPDSADSSSEIALLGNRVFRKYGEIIKDSARENQRPDVKAFFLKTVTGVASFVSQYPTMRAARQATSNPILREALGAGTVLTWGSVYSTATWSVVDDILIGKELAILDKKRTCLKESVYWLTLAIISLGVQTSDVYVSYVYTNDSLFWPIYVGGVFATFTVSSLNGAIQKFARTNNPLTRYLYKNTDKCKVFQAKENFCSLLEDYFLEFLQKAENHKKQIFFNLLKDDGGNLQFAKPLLFMLKEGLEEKIKNLRNENVCLVWGGKCIKIVGPILYLANYYLDIILVYDSSKLIVDNKYFAAFLIFISTTPNIFLDIEMSSSSINSLFWATAKHVGNCVKGDWGKYWNKRSALRGVGHLMGTAMTAFGIGSTVTVIDDNIGFKENKTVSIGILAFTAFFAANAVFDLTDKVIERLILWMAKPEERHLANVINRIMVLTSRVKLMSAEQFKEFLSGIENAVEYNESLLDDLANNPGYERLREKVLEKTSQLIENF